MINKAIKQFKIPKSVKSTTNPEEFFIVERLIRNAMQTPDGTILHSTHRHHYVTHDDENGETYMVDGGNEYLRRSVNKEPAIDISVYIDEDHEINRRYASWASFGKEGEGPMKVQAIKDMETDHILAILEGDWGAKYFREMFEAEILFRCDRDSKS